MSYKRKKKADFELILLCVYVRCVVYCTPPLLSPSVLIFVNVPQSGEKRHWDPARIRTWVFWILVRCSYQLSHWSSGIGAEDRWCLSIESQTEPLNRFHSAFNLVSTSELGISRHLACAIGTPQGLTGNISPSGEKPYKVFCQPKANCERIFYL